MIRRTWRSRLPTKAGSVCLFCRGRLTGAERPEHIVPEAMGGWLTTYDVCDACNHRFGGQVDSVASNDLFSVLREEAGLPLGVAPDLDPVDEEMRKFGPWRPDRDGKVRWSRDVV